MFLEASKSILLIFSALFPIVNPIGGSPIFLLLTQEYSADDRILLARRVAINSFVLLIVAVSVGTHILSFFGISLPVVQVGGAWSWFRPAGPCWPEAIRWIAVKRSTA